MKIIILFLGIHIIRLHRGKNVIFYERMSIFFKDEMNMKRLAAFIVFLLVGLSPIFAQENPTFLSSAKAQTLWKQFYEICKIPRASKNEKQLNEFISQIAKRHNAEFKSDAVGNLLVRLPATAGFEDYPIITCQAHLDMVYAKSSGIVHDFGKDPIIPIEENGWLKGKDTSLGADNGIGVAAMMALIEEKELSHGPLELLFTVDEEGDFTGIASLSPDFFKGRILVNLDSEEGHQTNIGCAGGQANTFTFESKKWDVAPYYDAYSLSVKGLRGGHSGVDIHYGRANAIKLLNRVLRRLEMEVPLRLASISGGVLDTAIPQEAEAVFFLPKENRNRLESLVNMYAQIYAQEYKGVDPEISLELKEDAFATSLDRTAFPIDFAQQLFDFIFLLPDGIRRMSREFPDLVDTSSNLGTVRTNDTGVVLTGHLQSMKIDSIKEMSRIMNIIASESNGVMLEGTPYLPWKPNANSKVLQALIVTHQKVFGYPIKSHVIHAGIECGDLLQKIPDLDMISFGPTIQSPHTVAEKVNIASVDDFWILLTNLLKTPFP